RDAPADRQADERRGEERVTGKEGLPREPAGGEDGGEGADGDDGARAPQTEREDYRGEERRQEVLRSRDRRGGERRERRERRTGSGAVLDALGKVEGTHRDEDECREVEVRACEAVGRADADDRDGRRNEQQREPAGERAAPPRAGAGRDLDAEQRDEEAADEVRSRSRPRPVLQERDEEEVAVAPAESALQVAEPGDGAVVAGVADEARVVETEVVVLRLPERPVPEPDHRDGTRRNRHHRL